MSAPPIPPDGPPQPLILYLVVPSDRHPYSFGRKKASGAIAPDALNFRTRTGLSRHTVPVSAGGLPPITSALNSLSGQRAQAPRRPYTRELLSARILPPRREIKSLLWRLKRSPGGRCPPPVRARRGGVFPPRSRYSPAVRHGLPVTSRAPSADALLLTRSQKCRADFVGTCFLRRALATALRMDSAHLSSHASPVRDAVTSPCDCGKNPLRPSRAAPELSLRSRSCAAAHDGSGALI